MLKIQPSPMSLVCAARSCFIRGHSASCDTNWSRPPSSLFLLKKARTIDLDCAHNEECSEYPNLKCCTCCLSRQRDAKQTTRGASLNSNENLILLQTFFQHTASVLQHDSCSATARYLCFGKSFPLSTYRCHKSDPRQLVSTITLTIFDTRWHEV